MKRGWWSQPFPPDGAVASEGIRKQLGTPTMDPLGVFLRESAQNSWDARVGTSPVTLSYEVYNVRSISLEPLAVPTQTKIADLISHLRSQPSSPVILVSDRGTTGLGGPIRSGVPSDENDFVNFVRNVGQPRDTEYGGGTYGFGKAALYSLSSASTVIVDTQCIHNDKLERRLIACALGDSFEHDNQMYTGRHWWGNLVDGIADPLLGADAAQAATELGLRGFNAAETGTDIYVLGAILGTNGDGTPRDIEQAAHYLRSVALWYLWPKLVEDERQPYLDLSVRGDGNDLSMPDPATLPRLACFVAALRKIRVGDGTPKKRSKAPKLVGHFAAEKDVYLPDVDDILEVAEPFEGSSRHCALMRDVELVVDYVPGPVPGLSTVQYGAVFKATKDADSHFSAAEPPTHDDWVTSHLSGTDLGVVRDAKTFIRHELDNQVTSPTTRGLGTSAPLGHLSSSLAKMLPGAEGDAGDGARPRNSAGGSGAGSKTPAFKLKGQPSILVLNNRALLAQVVDISPEFAGTLRAEAEVAVEGRREREAPGNAASPDVVAWRSADETVAGPLLRVPLGSETRWLVVVEPVPHTATLISVKQALEGEE